MSAGGDALRARREATGASLAAVSEATGVPVVYLAALEVGDPGPFPSRQHAEAHLRTYQRWLHANRGDTERTTSVPTLSGAERTEAGEPVPMPLGWVRVIAATAVIALVSAMVWDARRQPPIAATVESPTPAHADLPVAAEAPGRPPPAKARPVDPAPGEEPAADAALTVELRLQRTARLRVTADGKQVHHRVFAGGDELAIDAEARVEVDVPDVDAVTVWLDGERIRPLGRTRRPRRLVFVADGPRGR